MLLIYQNWFKYTMRTDPARARTCMDPWDWRICHDHKRPIVSFQDSSSSIQTSGARTQCSIEAQQSYPDWLWFRPTALVLVVLAVGFVVLFGAGLRPWCFSCTHNFVPSSTFCFLESPKLIPKEFCLLHWRVPEWSSHMPAVWSGTRIGSFAFVIIKTPIITRALQEAIQEKLGWFCHIPYLKKLILGIP